MLLPHDYAHCQLRLSTLVHTLAHPPAHRRQPLRTADGKSGTPGGPIPPNAPLVFYMEMVRYGNIKGDKPRLGSIMSS